jgi:hypothetical protein
MTFMARILIRATLSGAQVGSEIPWRAVKSYFYEGKNLTAWLLCSSDGQGNGLMEPQV